MTDARQRWRLPGLALGSYAAVAAVQSSGTLRAAALLAPVAAVSAWWLLRTPERWLLVFLCAALALPPLPIRLGDSGPHVAIAIAGAGLVAGLLRLPEWRLRVSAIEMALPAYMLVLLASLGPAALYSGPELAFASAARVMLFAISIYVYFYAAHGPRGATGDSAGVPAPRWGLAVQLVLGAAAISAAFACVDFYYQFPAPAGFGPQYVWLASGVYRRAQGVFYEASTLGNLCASLLVLIAVCIARGKESPIRRLWLPGAAAVLTAAMLLSFSRASLINVAVSLSALLWIERRRIAWPRLVAALSAGAIAGLAAMYWAAPQMLEFYFVRLRWTATFALEGSTGVLSGRVESWSYLFRFLADNPWHALLGIGYKTLPYSDFAGKPVVADNAYLSALVETGVAGLAVLVLLNLSVLRLAWRAAHHEHPAAKLFGTWIGCFWIGQMVQMFSGDLFTYWRVLPLYFWALGMAVRYSTPPE